MLRGFWTHAPARMMGGLTVVLALGAFVALEAAAADAPTPSEQPPVASPAPPPDDAAAPSAAAPSAAAPSAAAPSAAAPSAAAPSAAPRETPPAAAPPSTAPPAATELDGPAPRTTAGTGGSTQSGLAGCAVWTDRCVICQRDSGVIACSNIGISCQPQPLMCLRPEAAPEKKPEN
jgi:hypothetical protein